MDAVLLAGGFATRLWPITIDRPKMFLPLGSGTVIDESLRQLDADDRIDTVYVSTNARFADEFQDYIDRNRVRKAEVSVEGTASEDEKFGVVGALAELVDREGVEDDLLVVAGDNLLGFPLSSFVDAFERERTPQIAAYDVGDPERARSYGVVELRDGRVTAFEEKPDDPDSSLVSVACYAFPSDVLPAFDEYLAAGNNPDEPGWFVRWLVGRRPVSAFTFDGVWFDVGTAGSYLDALEWRLDGEAHVAPDATVDGARLGSGVQVLSGADVSNSTLERAVVFEDATIRDSEVRSSIVDEHASVDRMTLDGALVAPHSRIE